MSDPLSHLAERIQRMFPLAKVELDEPVHAGGQRHLDIRLGNRLVVIDEGAAGFGVSLILEAALDGAPDFRFSDADRALACVSLLLSEAQDAEFKDELGVWEATTAANDIEREDLLVEKGDRRPPRRNAA